MKRRWTVYIVRCSDGTLYTGISVDVARRVAQHSTGRGAKYTRTRGPVTLVYTEGSFGHVSYALKRERQIKNLTRPQKLAIVAEYQQRHK